MATNFDSTAFRASPFMRALAAEDVLPRYEKNTLAHCRRSDDEALSRIWRIRATVAFHAAMVASEGHYLARVLLDNWAPGDPRTRHLDAAHDRAAVVLIDAIEQWSKIPKPTAFGRKSFAKTVREYQRGIACSDLVETWREREPVWLATVGA